MIGLHTLLDRRLVEKVSQLSAAGAWSEVLAASASPAALKRSAKLLKLRVVAALEAGDEAAIRSCIETAACDEVSLNARIFVASRLSDDGRSEDAWAVVGGIDEANAPAALGAMFHRIGRRTQSEAIRREALARHRSMVATVRRQGGSRTRLAFPSRNAAEPPGRHRIDYLRSAAVEPRHEEVFHTLERNLEAAIARVKPPVVMAFHDVFVNRIGQMWRAGGEVIASAGAPLKPIAAAAAIPEYDEAVLCTNGTKGFYHWYVERLSSLTWRFAADAPQAPILFGDHAAGFQSECLRLAGRAAHEVARIGDAAFCRTVYVANMSLATLSHWDRFALTYDAITAAAAREAAARQRSPLLYISRRDTSRRVLANEAELEDRLAALGVAPLIFTKMPLAEQIEAVRAARLIIAPHGAGLSHLITARPGTEILELMPIHGAHHSLRFNFARLSRLRGHRHTLWLEGINPVTQSWRVDADAICAVAGRIIDRLG